MNQEEENKNKQKRTKSVIVHAVDVVCGTVLLFDCYVLFGGCVQHFHFVYMLTHCSTARDYYVRISIMNLLKFIQMHQAQFNRIFISLVCQITVQVTG